MSQGMSLGEKQILEWYLDIGVDECTADAPVNRLSQRPQKDMQEVVQHTNVQNQNTPLNTVTTFKPVKKSESPPLGAMEAVQDARKRALQCETVEDLRLVVEGFDGCPLKRTAQQTVFEDGNPKARIMILGEAPDTEEDRQGKPFVGQSGQLLDKMFQAIGFSRYAEDLQNALYLSNIIYWRPPGNRDATDSEIEICRPFVERHIELVNPDVLVVLGGMPVKTILRTHQGITRLRGKWATFKTPNLALEIPILPMLHPAFLLKSPDRKKYAWQDLLALKAKFEQ